MARNKKKELSKRGEGRRFKRSGGQGDFLEPFSKSRSARVSQVFVRSKGFLRRGSHVGVGLGCFASDPVNRMDLFFERTFKRR